MAVVDDCGDPFTAGSVVATFSNGDPPLPLTALREGNWGGTWTPRGVSASGVLLTGQSRNPGGDLQGAAHIVGGVRSNPNPPVISPGGIVSSASFATEAPLAPGSIIAIFGTHLADEAIAAQALPLPSQLGQTQVIVAGQSMPLFFVSDSQINAMLPYDIPVNRPYQVIVQRGTSATIPETITLAAAGPAVFTKDQSGIGPGLVFDAQFRSNDPANPAAAGDAIVIYTTGLGDVTPAIPAGAPAPLDALSPTSSPATVTIGGVDAPQVLFAGLAPGFTGLYQVNVVVPAGVAPGEAVPIIITVADRPGPPVTLAVQ
jgi:adhesin/invasin